MGHLRVQSLIKAGINRRINRAQPVDSIANPSFARMTGAGFAAGGFFRKDMASRIGV